VPVTNAAFTAASGRALARPAMLPMPAAPLRIALGAFAEELLLSGHRAMPMAFLKSGLRFTYRAIDDALTAIVGRAQISCAKPLPDCAPVRGYWLSAWSMTAANPLDGTNAEVTVRDRTIVERLITIPGMRSQLIFRKSGVSSKI
jgi:Domain of unknown function (DUF1731)